MSKRSRGLLTKKNGRFLSATSLDHRCIQKPILTWVKLVVVDVLVCEVVFVVRVVVVNVPLKGRNW